MNTDLFLSFEQQLKKERGHKKELDFKAYKGDSAPAAPAQKKETYSAWGNKATQDNFTPSAFNQSQMDYYQSAIPTLQAKLYDTQGNDSQARAQADAIKANGLKSFTRTMDDSFGSDMANIAGRFGSLDNSTYDSALKRFGQAKSEGLQALQNDYDANYQNNLNNIQSYNQNNLNSALNGMNNLYNLANGYSANALNSSNATNGFNQQSYANQLAQYNAKQAQNNALYGTGAQVAGTAAMFLSDKRAKKNIVKIGEKNGINIYEFEYKPEYNQPKGKHIGVIAQEVEHIPNAVIEKDGIKYVNYDVINKKIA